MQSMYKLFTLFICSLSLLFFTSAAVAPAKVVEETPVERTTLSQKELKKQLRQQARVARLEIRLERATSDQRKMRLQKRIDQTKQTKEVTVLGILALVFAFVFAPVGLILAVIAKNNDGGFIADLAFWISLIFIIAVVVWIVIAILNGAAAASRI